MTGDLFQSSVAMADAKNYNEWTFELFRPFLKGDVLEVGCGVGTFTTMIARASCIRRLVSVDVSEDAVACCKARLGSAAEVSQADVRTVSGVYDLILCMNVLEHIEDDAGALGHMLSLLRPGGRLFLLVPAHAVLYSSFDKESGHYRRYDKAGMRTLIATVAQGAPPVVEQFYFNTVGAIGYFVVYRLMNKPPREDAGGEIGWFDRVVVPLQRRIEGRWAPFGISLVNVITAAA